MVLRKFENGNVSKDKSPWVNEYIKQGGKVGDSVLIDSYRVTDENLIIFADEFKGCLYGNSEIRSFFEAAVEEYLTTNLDSPSFWMVAEKGGKISLAIDDEDVNYRWIKTDKGAKLVKKQEEAIGTSTTPVLNPFLLHAPPTATRSRKKASVDNLKGDVTFS